MDLLLIFAGRLYLRIDSFLFDWGCTHRLFPYWQELFFCAFNKDRLFPFQNLFICTYQLLPFLAVCTFLISIPSFLGRLYFSNINSFLSWPSVLFQYQILPFLRFDGMMPLCNACSAYCPLGRGVLGHEDGKYTAAALTGLPALHWNQVLAVGPSRGDALIWAGMIPASFLLIGPSTTRPCANTSPPRLVVTEVHKRLWCAAFGNGAVRFPTICIYESCFLLWGKRKY